MPGGDLERILSHHVPVSVRVVEPAVGIHINRAFDRGRTSKKIAGERMRRRTRKYEPCINAFKTLERPVAGREARIQPLPRVMRVAVVAE